MLLGDKLRLQEGLTNTEKRIADYILQKSSLSIHTHPTLPSFV